MGAFSLLGAAVFLLFSASAFWLRAKSSAALGCCSALSMVPRPRGGLCRREVLLSPLLLPLAASAEPAQETPLLDELAAVRKALEPLPALRSCENLQELTLMHARMARMPPELQHVRGTLRRLCLANNEIRRIEHLDGMSKLHSLFLQDNQISDLSGLDGCPSLMRLWLMQNQITSAASLPAPVLEEVTNG